MSSEHEVTIISAEGTQHGVVEGNTIRVTSDDGRKLLNAFEFSSYETRDTIIDEAFPGRKCTNIPGCFDLPDGRMLTVNQLRVCEYSAQPTEKQIKKAMDDYQPGKQRGDVVNPVELAMLALLLNKFKNHVNICTFNADNVECDTWYNVERVSDESNEIHPSVTIFLRNTQ